MNRHECAVEGYLCLPGPGAPSRGVFPALAELRPTHNVLTCREAIRAAYDKLHAAGVVHNDINLCNIMVSGPRLSLVDFEGALRAGDAEFDDALKAEQGKLAEVTA